MLTLLGQRQRHLNLSTLCRLYCMLLPARWPVSTGMSRLRRLFIIRSTGYQSDSESLTNCDDGIIMCLWCKPDFHCWCLYTSSLSYWQTKLHSACHGVLIIPFPKTKTVFAASTVYCSEQFHPSTCDINISRRLEIGFSVVPIRRRH